MTDEEKKEYTECLNCDFWCDENECRSCNGYSKFKPNDEIKVVFLEKENLELKKQVEELQERIKKMKHCINCKYLCVRGTQLCDSCIRDGKHHHEGKETDKWELLE